MLFSFSHSRVKVLTFYETQLNMSDVSSIGVYESVQTITMDDYYLSW